MELDARIVRRLRLQDLDVFVTVAQAGSMGKAAKLLHTSQPAVSKTISDLEHALGVQLVDRHRQGVEPTEYGHALLNCARAVFDDLRQGVKNIAFLADPTAGEVSIGSGSFFAANFVSSVIDRLSSTHPRIVFRIMTAPIETLERELRDRTIDFYITRSYGALAEELNFMFLFEDTFIVAVGVSHPLARRRHLCPCPHAPHPNPLPPTRGRGGMLRQVENQNSSHAPSRGMTAERW